MDLNTLVYDRITPEEEIDLLRKVKNLGYIVHHRGEARHVLSWHRAGPLDRDFQTEALEEIRSQLRPKHITFGTHNDNGLIIFSAYVRIL